MLADQQEFLRILNDLNHSIAKIEVNLNNFKNISFQTSSNLNQSCLNDEIDKIIQSVLDNNDGIILSVSIRSIGLISKLDKSILKGNINFVDKCLRRLGQLLIENDHVKVEILNFFCNLFDLTEQNDNNEISEILNEWYSKIADDRTKLTQSIFITCINHGAFVDIHRSSLNLIRVLCKHSWGQAEFAKFTSFINYIINRATETDPLAKQIKIELVKVLVDSHSTSSIFGVSNHDELRRVLEHPESSGAEFVKPKNKRPINQSDSDEDKIESDLKKNKGTSSLTQKIEDWNATKLRSYSSINLSEDNLLLKDYGNLPVSNEQFTTKSKIKLLPYKDDLNLTRNLYNGLYQKLKVNLEESCKMFGYPLSEDTNEYLLQSFVTDLIKVPLLEFKDNLEKLSNQSIFVKRECSLSYPKNSSPEKSSVKSTEYKIEEIRTDELITHGRCEFVVKKLFQVNFKILDFNIMLVEVKLSIEQKGINQTKIQLRDLFLANDQKFTVYGVLTNLKEFMFFSFDGNNYFSTRVENCVMSKFVNSIKNDIIVTDQMITVLELFYEIFCLSLPLDV